MISFNILDVIFGNIKVNRAITSHRLEITIANMSKISLLEINNGLKSEPNGPA